MSCSGNRAVCWAVSRRWLLVLAACSMLTGAQAWAHVGSPDIYAEGSAGPYRLLVTVRPPLVIPGVAEIEVRAVPTNDGGPTRLVPIQAVNGIDIAPIPLTGEASKHPPVADAMKRSAQDGQFFTGALWIMASGSWQVRFTVHGSQGTGVLSIPVPATSSSTLGMAKGMAAMLAGLGLLLVAGVVGIVGAAVRDAQLAPGERVSASRRKRARVAMAIALVVMIGAVIFGRWWWGLEASDYARYVYKPLTMQATLTTQQNLTLKIEDPGWLKSRKVDDFVLDHDHLMHLYLIRQPGMDVVYHLHPEQVATGDFELQLPSIPEGDYKLYADVVHATGFPETMVSSLTLPEIHGRPLAGDDAKGLASPLQAGATCNTKAPASFQFEDGYSMVWNNAAVLKAKTPQVFAFSLLDGHGKAPEDMSLYMGMVGHAAFVKDDGTVFAHVHPSGTVSMAALMMAAEQNGATPEKMGTHSMSGMVMPGDKLAVVEGKPSQLPNAVGFPYGFPTPGAYRVFVQMKHGTTVETGSFDACAQ